MRIGFGKLNKHAIIPVGDTGIISIATPIPLELQVGERVDLKTGLVVQVPEGYILSIQSLPWLLIFKGLEVLGPPFVVPEDKDELNVALYNRGKSQINLQPGMQVGVAILQITETIEIEEFSPKEQKIVHPQDRPPKRDPFKFEVS